MMRIFLALCLIALVLSCAHKDAGKGLIKLTARNSTPEKELPRTETFDSTFFIGYIDYFPETREFYTSLFYKEGHEYPDEELLESKLDSVIMLDDDWGRERLPMEEAKKLLVLAGLDSISIYTRSHQLVCRSPLIRVEYLWNGLENYFIAVFRSDGKFFEQSEELYGITSTYSPIDSSSFSAEEINDRQLNAYLVKNLGMNKHLEWDMRHYRIAPNQTTLSIISYYSMTTNQSTSLLTALENNNVRILNKEVDNYHFLNILPLPIKMNGKPLLLISAGYPSSDVLWDYLAGFDGTTYNAIDYNRMPLKHLDAN